MFHTVFVVIAGLASKTMEAEALITLPEVAPARGLTVYVKWPLPHTVPVGGRMPAVGSAGQSPVAVLMTLRRASSRPLTTFNVTVIWTASSTPADPAMMH